MPVSCIGSLSGNTDEPRLDLDVAKATIGNLGLTSVIVGDYLIILKKSIDVEVDDEPYISFILFYDTTSGRFFKRIWNKTVATGKTTDLATLVKVCRAYFNRGKPCLAYIKLQGRNELPENTFSACHSFFTSSRGSETMICTECKKARDTIHNGMREAEDIKVEDFEESKGDIQCNKVPYEETFDDAVCQDVEVSEQLLEMRANMLRARQRETKNIMMHEEFKNESQNNDQSRPIIGPKQNYGDLTAEALEGGKTLGLHEIIKSIRDRHTYVNMSETSWKAGIRRALQAKNRFEMVDEAGHVVEGKGKRAKYRLSTSIEAPDKCDFCDRRFPEGRKTHKYRWHLKSWHGWNNFHCSSCDFKANFAVNVFEHIEEEGHTDTTLTCPSCNNNFDKAGMISHYQGCIRKKQRERIKRSQLVNAPCPTCGKVMKTKKAYRQHVMSHLRKQGEQDPVDVPYSKEKYNLYYHCDKCEKKYITKYMLKKHIQVSPNIFRSNKRY